MDEHQAPEIDRTESIVVSLTDKLVSLQTCILAMQEEFPEYATRLSEAGELCNDVISLFVDAPIKRYGLSLEKFIRLAESQIATGKDNANLRADNEILRLYISGLEQRLKDANDEAIRLFQKREYKQP
jgi:hypothetical protein